MPPQRHSAGHRSQNSAPELVLADQLVLEGLQSEPAAAEIADQFAEHQEGMFHFGRDAKSSCVVGNHADGGRESNVLLLPEKKKLHRAP